MREPTSRTALVTDAERGSALAVIRSLGRAGWRVIAASADANAPGFRSRYASRTLTLPAPRDEPERFAEGVLEEARERGVDLVIPVSEDAVHPLAAARERFAAVTHLALAEEDALAAVVDKHHTVELAHRLGVPTPPTRFVRSVEEADAALGELPWPIVVKPQRSRAPGSGGRAFETCEVGYANDRETVLRRVESAGGRYGLLLQAYCPGVGHGVEMLVDRGRPIAAFQHRRIAEVPTTGGASALRESVALDPALLAHARSLVAAIGWSGLIMVEFKVGDAPRLMEINGRVWGSLPLAVASGMDFPARWAALCLGDSPGVDGDEVELDVRYDVGVLAHNPDLMSVWFASVLTGRKRASFVPAPRRRDALRVARLLRRSRSDLAAPDDPAPARGTARRIARHLAGKVRKGRDR